MFIGKTAQILSSTDTNISPAIGIESVYYEKLNRTMSDASIYKLSVSKHMAILLYMDTTTNTYKVKETNSSSGILNIPFGIQSSDNLFNGTTSLNDGVTDGYVVVPSDQKLKNPMIGYANNIEYIRANTMYSGDDTSYMAAYLGYKKYSISDLLRNYISHTTLEKYINWIESKTRQKKEDVSTNAKISNHKLEKEELCEKISERISDASNRYNDIVSTSYDIIDVTDTDLNEIKDLISAKLLDYGNIYKIRYNPNLNDPEFYNHEFYLYLRAISNNEFAPVAIAAKIEDEDDNYFDGQRLEDWEILYDISENRITYMKDEYGNEAPFDFKNKKIDDSYLFSDVAKSIDTDALYMILIGWNASVNDSSLYHDVSVLTDKINNSGIGQLINNASIGRILDLYKYTINSSSYIDLVFKKEHHNNDIINSLYLVDSSDLLDSSIEIEQKLGLFFDNSVNLIELTSDTFASITIDELLYGLPNYNQIDFKYIRLSNPNLAYGLSKFMFTSEFPSNSTWQQWPNMFDNTVKRYQNESGHCYMSLPVFTYVTDHCAGVEVSSGGWINNVSTSTTSSYIDAIGLGVRYDMIPSSYGSTSFIRGPKDYSLSSYVKNNSIQSEKVLISGNLENCYIGPENNSITLFNTKDKPISDIIMAGNNSGISITGPCKNILIKNNNGIINIENSYNVNIGSNNTNINIINSSVLNIGNNCVDINVQKSTNNVIYNDCSNCMISNYSNYNKIYQNNTGITMNNTYMVTVALESSEDTPALTYHDNHSFYTSQHMKSMRNGVSYNGRISGMTLISDSSSIEITSLRCYNSSLNVWILPSRTSSTINYTKAVTYLAEPDKPNIKDIDVYDKTSGITINNVSIDALSFTMNFADGGDKVYDIWYEYDKKAKLLNNFTVSVFSGDIGRSKPLYIDTTEGYGDIGSSNNMYIVNSSSAIYTYGVSKKLPEDPSIKILDASASINSSLNFVVTGYMASLIDSYKLTNTSSDASIIGSISLNSNASLGIGTGNIIPNMSKPSDYKCLVNLSYKLNYRQNVDPLALSFYYKNKIVKTFDINIASIYNLISVIIKFYPTPNSNLTTFLCPVDSFIGIVECEDYRSNHSGTIKCLGWDYGSNKIRIPIVNIIDQTSNLINISPNTSTMAKSLVYRVNSEELLDSSALLLYVYKNRQYQYGSISFYNGSTNINLETLGINTDLGGSINPGDGMGDALVGVDKNFGNDGPGKGPNLV